MPTVSFAIDTSISSVNLKAASVMRTQVTAHSTAQHSIAQQSRRRNALAGKVGFQLLEAANSVGSSA